ncbi:monovalent cation/H+ antiporter subunit D family protein [Serinicoccus chungangensis]|uniref:monovalent cation/H+ antiporter subunit D family protein n=1 Tax=Serinicoccus chungangensis TaxID=767452 RepID=UPI001EE8097F|nr:monovalent cation/H+ antiporter subunit D family protein [Serinicoccus chungangensis]
MPGVAIPFVSDTFSALMILVTSFTVLMCLVFMTMTGENRYRLVTPLVLMLLGGVNGAFLTGDLFNLFVFVEVMLLPSYALIAVTGTWRRLGVGRTFVIVNLLTSTILLIGVGLVYATAETVNLALLVGAGSDPRTMLSSGVVLLALSIKAALVPMHTWLPRTYPATSASVMALFSALHTKVALYALFRITSTLYEGQPPWILVLAVMVGLSLVVGSYSTFGERVMRRALSWQMVAGVGHILLGLMLFTQFSLAAGIFYMIHHIITMGALILGAGAIEQTYGSGRYERLSGIIRRDRLLTIGYALALMSLVGLPPSSGFFGKVGLVQASAQAGGAWQAVFITLIVVGALGSLVAMQRLWVGVFWGPDMEDYLPDSPETGRGATVTLTDDVRVTPRLLAPMAVLVLTQLAMFVLAGPIMQVTTRAAQGLVDLQPYVQAVTG